MVLYHGIDLLYMEDCLRSHPKALAYLFLTEMWERFGFYVVQGMMVLYMTESFGFSDEKSFTISGTFMALAYVAPIFGGFLADRLLGFKTAIYYGAGFLGFGYALLFLPCKESFYLGLSTIIVGTGLFKPNISSLLGSLYQPEDPTRDAGFTIFYIGINLGALFAGLSSGFIKQEFGWGAAFALASLGLILGLMVFHAGSRWMEVPPGPLPLRKYTFLTKPWFCFYYPAIIFLLSCVLKSEILAKWLLPLVGLALFFFVLVLTVKQTQPHRNRLFLLNLLIISSVVFWMLFVQLFMSTTLFIERMVDRNVWGFHLPTMIFYSLESVFVILLGPFFAWSWQALSHNEMNPSPLLKFVLAMICAALCFVVLGSSTYFLSSEHLVSPLWIVVAYLLLTIGELLLSPIGLSTVTTHAPPQLAGLMMGVWFVATGFGGTFAGWLAKFSSIPKESSPAMMLEIYRHTFFYFSQFAFDIAIILFLIQLSLKLRLGYRMLALCLTRIGQY